MTNLSIVPANKIRKDPRNFAHLYPSMPLYKYKKATEDWYRLKCVRALEEVASMQGLFVVPAICIHWARKKKLSDRHVDLFGRSYYLLSEKQLTKSERIKYLEKLNDPEDD